MEEEAKKLYEKVLEQITLYNQYKNNVSFDRAYEISKLIVRINNLAIKNGLYKGDPQTYLSDFEHKLESEERNRAVLFI
jgi:hypothetical protein